jgi:hypothetical protein
MITTNTVVIILSTVVRHLYLSAVVGGRGPAVFALAGVAFAVVRRPGPLPDGNGRRAVWRRSQIQSAVAANARRRYSLSPPAPP